MPPGRRPLDSLSPARRRFVLGVAALVLVVVAGVAVGVVAARDPAVEPADQATPGPVLLVPGYGGSTGGLDVLAGSLRDRDVTVVAPEGDGRGDLRDQAADLRDAVDRALDRTGAPSVDLVGYSAGGVVVRYYVARLGGDAVTRRVVTLASPHHGTDLAGLAGDLAPGSCPEACRQLDPDSELLAGLNAGDETPAGPRWIALWTEDDQTVVPPDSGDLEGALAFSLQSICPDAVVSHADVPSSPEVARVVAQVLGTDDPIRPDGSVCVSP